LRLSLVLLVTACGGGGGGSGGGSAGSSGSGHLKLLATDDPFPFDLVKEAHVHVTEIKVHHDSQADSGFTTIYSGPGFDLSLLDLRNGATVEAANTVLPAGSIGQIRLIIDSASLTLTNDNVYSTDLGNLDLTGADKSGLKIFVDPPIEIAADVDTTVLLDFDLTKTFHAVPANDPPNANKFLLMPGIRASNLVDVGEVKGIVTKDDGTGVQVGVDLASVYVLPPGETDPAKSVASSATDSTGHYAILGVAPGTYDVLALKDALQGTLAGVVVVATEVTTADVVIQ
jgi:hypothetical protein